MRRRFYWAPLSSRHTRGLCRVYRVYRGRWWYLDSAGAVQKGQTIEAIPVESCDMPTARLWAMLRGWPC